MQRRQRSAGAAAVTLTAVGHPRQALLLLLEVLITIHIFLGGRKELLLDDEEGIDVIPK